MKNNNSSPLFVPSSEKLLAMVAAAEAKFDAARERERQRKEERANELYARGVARAVRGRFYDAIQRGTGR